MDLPAARRALDEGVITSTDLVEAGIRRAAEVDPTLHAIAWLDAARARRLAALADAAPRDARRGSLHGIPIGIKDVFDTAGIPTENGSALFAGRVPAESAQVVTALERSGAIVFAKTVTTPLSFLAPGPTTNPWNVGHTPGGSSMGSAAAVAARIIPGAIGTQSSGSVIRPAAFCGVVGFKPTGGRLSGKGVLDFSRTLDQVGSFARSIEGVAMLCAAMAGDVIERWWAGPAAARPRFAAIRTSDWPLADQAMRDRFDADIALLRKAGARVDVPELPAGLDDASALVRTIVAYEAAASLGAMVADAPDKVSDQARAFFADGARITTSQYEEARAIRLRLIDAFTEWIADYDAVLTPPAIGEAPGLETTGDPRFCARWSLVGAPAIVIPTGAGPTGLPLGLQLVGRPERDASLVRIAAWTEQQLPPPMYVNAR
jgi:Asp-tRNA(Asn)/Glu-tRNA(Gln) amidotransferase A subunit family amidase